jgi:chemotaxis protein methyltransferase CheR
MDKENISNELESLEIRLLLEAVFSQYGYDFRDYNPASISRRVQKRVKAEKLKTISGLTERVLHDQTCMSRLFFDLSINVTTMFRDSDFFLAFREKVIPLLATYPFIRIWVAGCSTGEEVFSISIILKEAGLLERCRIYATDINEEILETARSGIFPLKMMREYTANYHASGGTSAFSGYYTAKYDSAIFNPYLKENIVFAKHDLAIDTSFNEFNAIICRNTMIYFNRRLQNRVFELFHNSLATFGIIGLGSSESLKFSTIEGSYEQMDGNVKLYRRVK